MMTDPTPMTAPSPIWTPLRTTTELPSTSTFFSNFDWGRFCLLIPHPFRSHRIAVVVVRENNIRSNTAVVTDLDPALDIEFDVSANEDAIADHDIGSWEPETIIFEVDVRFQFTATANLELFATKSLGVASIHYTERLKFTARWWHPNSDRSIDAAPCQRLAQRARRHQDFRRLV